MVRILDALEQQITRLTHKGWPEGSYIEIHPFENYVTFHEHGRKTTKHLIEYADWDSYEEFAEEKTSP